MPRAGDIGQHILAGNHHLELIGDVPIVPLSGDADVVGTCWHVNGKWRREARFQLNYLRRSRGGCFGCVVEDYDSWAAKGNDQWAFPNLIQYFRKVEADPDFSDDDFHSSEGAIVVRWFKPDEMRPDQTAFYEACREAGFPDSPDHNAPDASGVGPVPLKNPNGIRFSTALGYLNPARHRLNLTIKPNCVTRRIIFEGKRAVGVEVESGGERFTVEAREIILSSGAIGSPHIMLLSGVGPADNLREIGIPVTHDLPGVGQSLRDHPMVYTTWQTKPDYPLDGFAPRLQTILRWTA